jgi:hypothetical protein
MQRRKETLFMFCLFSEGKDPKPALPLPNAIKEREKGYYGQNTFLERILTLWLLLSQTRSALFKARHKRAGK